MTDKNTYFSDVVPYLVDYYEQFQTLPTKVLECSKGTGAYTCFGANLKGKVAKAGSIEKLLRSFVGRGAKKSEKIAAKIEARPKKKVQVKVTDTVTNTETLVEAEAIA